MRLKLVKYLIDASTDKTLGRVYRFVDVPMGPGDASPPSPPWVLQDRAAKFCELIQLVGIDVSAGGWEAMALPAYLAVDQSPEQLIEDAIQSGWTLDTDSSSGVDFEAKITEEAQLRDLFSDEEAPPVETTPVEEEDDDSAGLEIEPWKEEHDKLFPDKGIQEP